MLRSDDIALNPAPSKPYKVWILALAGLAALALSALTQGGFRGFGFRGSGSGLGFRDTSRTFSEIP